MVMSGANKCPQIPPLREIPLNTRPLTKRAVAWSCDGELAVAADDSVHVFVPLFPDPSNDDEAVEDEGNGDSHGSGTDEEDGNNVDLRPAFLRRKQQTIVRKQGQFATGQRQILVSHPRLHPNVNRELFEVAGLPFPSGDKGAGGGPRRGRGSDAESDQDSAAEDEQEDEAWVGEEGVEEETTTFGAGMGVISSAGSTLNHVVSIAWSPSGLGRNRRPVLAVLTSAGYIGFYGDRAPAAKTGGGFTSMSRDDGALKQRDLSSWGILFGAGEQLLVPGQEIDFGEKVIGMAWAREIGPGQALLAYVNDDQEVAVLSIQSVSITAGSDATGAANENTIWTVREVARFKAEGPHPASSPWEPDWAPSGTCFGLRWSPWLSSSGSRSCVLSYFGRNYVGFRKITLMTPWARGTDPDIVVDERDTYGKCIHLSTDGFAEFEDAIWTKDQSKVVRGLIVTGFHVKPFQVSISGPQPSAFQAEPHSTDNCGTTYLDPALDRPSANPIVDLIIHPPDMMRPSDTPTYTLVRLSATPTNHDWFQTNATLPDFSSSSTGISEAKPQWAVDLQQKLAVLVPADAHMRHTAGEDDEDDSEAGDSGKEPEDDDGLSDEDDDMDIEKAVQAPEVHPTRFRMYGLAAAPGGRATAALVSAHSTQTPDRIGWWGLRSVLLFGSVERPRRRGDNREDGVMDPGLLRLTTEGRMLNWMYGAGPDVDGITAAAGDDAPDGAQAGGARTVARELFRDGSAAQRCDLCGGDMRISSQPDSRQGMSVCTQGHFFSTCGASGLAIQAPGISHTCGVCGVRTLKVEELLRRAPGLEQSVREELTADVCGSCGGKFVD